MWGNMMEWGGYGGSASFLGMAPTLPWWVLIVLRERYARGEIDKSEFDARRRDLA